MLCYSSYQRLVIQRVVEASVTVNGAVVGSIHRGLLVLVGISAKDRNADLEYMVKKMLNLRLWDDGPKTWAQNVMQKKHDVLLVSQFTLYGVPKGNKPDFHLAMPPEKASAVYDEFVKRVKKEYSIASSTDANSANADGPRIACGQFGADMKVALVNDGPVTITLETDSMDFSKENEKEDKMKQRWAKQAAGSKNNIHAAESSSSVAVGSSSECAPSPGNVSSTNISAVSPVSPSPDALDDVTSSQSAGDSFKSSDDPAASAKSTRTAASATGTVTTSGSAIVQPVVSPLAASSFSALIGGTSLIYLRHISEATGCAIYGKAEYENPGGSIKDRPALGIIQDAEASGELVHGEPGFIVEGTAGNTGIGLTLVGASRGYKTIIVMADNNSQEKKDALRSMGAIVVEVPMVPFTNPNNYVHVAKKLYESMKAHSARQVESGGRPIRVILGDQWSNVANRRMHYETTGPEIWTQTKGRVDAFCCGVGTGGTLSGVSQALKKRNPKVKSVLIDPNGSALKSYFETGELKSEGSSIAEGIGQGRLCDNLIRDGFKPDQCIRVDDDEALQIAYNLLAREGHSIGSSSAVNVCGAYKLAQQLGPGHTIVTVLCDSGTRYQSKMYNSHFLKSKNLPIPPWIQTESGEYRQLQEMAEEWLKQAIVTVQPK